MTVVFFVTYAVSNVGPCERVFECPTYSLAEDFIRSCVLRGEYAIEKVWVRA